MSPIPVPATIARMPNKKAPICGCGVVVVEMPKSRNGSLSTRKLPIRISKSKSSKSDGRNAKKQHDDGRSKNRGGETGGSSSVAEQSRPATESNKHEKRLNHSRRTRSADRAESHYTYIDSASSILGGVIRENAIPEALYATIPDTPYATANETGNSQLNAQSRSQAVYAIRSMVSPPPTYDVAIAKTWQSGLPPTYEEYLSHKYAMVPRSHTPPPPWSDSTTTTTTPSVLSRRDLLASQPELRENLAQLSLSQNDERSSRHHNEHVQRVPTVFTGSGVLNYQRILSERQVGTQQRPRHMPTRSRSETRVQQQRIPSIYEDGAFCMETTALQSAFENGISLCSLM